MAHLLGVRGMALAALVFLAGAAAWAGLGDPLAETVPDAGSYRLYLPAAKEGAKAPLVVWLHPAGGEANELVTRWWPELHDLGYALMLPRSKDPAQWTFDEGKTVFAYIDHAAGKHPIDPKKVVLLGFSAGGQMAFYMGMTDGARLAGIVTMSAVPIKSIHDLSTPMPPKECKDSLAYYMILGEQEEAGVRIAKRAQMELLADGFSAVLRVAKRAGHQFHESEKPGVIAWLKEVAAGKRPAQEETAELAKTAPEQVKAYREALEHARRMHEQRVAVPAKVFDDIKENLGKPSTLKWQEAGETDQGGKFKVTLPEGWTLGEATAKGESTALQLIHPDKDTKVVMFLGRTVKKEGLRAHYQKWFKSLTDDNQVDQARSGTFELPNGKWFVHTFLTVPKQSAGDPAARRVLLIALHPLNDHGTEWRSLHVMCPEDACATGTLAEVIRGVLEKNGFQKPQE